MKYFRLTEDEARSLYRYLHYGVDNLGVKEMDAMATV